MFHFLGKIISRSWPIWLVGWTTLAIVLYLTAPPWERVAKDSEFGFLPADAPTREGQAVFKRAFPEDKQNSNVVIVVSRADGSLTQDDLAFVKNVIKPAFQKLAEEHGGLADQAKPSGAARRGMPIVAAIRAFDDAGSGQLLMSPDRQATLVLLELTSELLETRNWPIVSEIEALLAQWRTQGKAPPGLELNLIGSAVVGRDMTTGQKKSSQATEFWTVVIVIAILLLIYRAPFLALIPLTSVFMATQLSLKLLSDLAEAGVVTLFAGVEIYITVILYGTGVDYCLFLIARYQEERERCADCRDALANAVGHVGPALAASAATVMFGIGMMVFARFGKFHHAGFAMAFALAVSLCVVLTFTTSLLRFAGRWAFWPTKLADSPAAKSAPREPWLWARLGDALLRRPATIWFAAVLLMAPLAVGGILHADDVDYNFVRRLPPDAPSVAGTKALQQHFPAGAAGTITVLIYDPEVDFLERDGIGQIELSVLSDRIRTQMTPLELADVRTWSQPLGTGFAARQATGAPLAEINRGWDRALKYYISSTGELKGQVTRMELTMLEDPLSRQGIATLNRIEEFIRSELTGKLRNAKLYFLGVTADMRDLRQITSGDQLRIQVLVVSCVLVILIVLLRSVAVCLYLMASVLFSYYATLGATLLLFWSLDPEGFAGLDWKVPIFLFTILVAIGEDYNIFLMTRVREEQARHGPVEGVRFALVGTGRIITSCGIIMAGTFASLMAGTMEDLRHLGFALSFGVLLDTFVVRPILAPAFLIVLERGRLLWSKLTSISQGDKQPQPADSQAQER